MTQHKFPPLPAKQFAGFKYRLDELEEGESAILKFPDLSAYGDVFTSNEITCDQEVMIRYFIMMYTPGSFAISQYSNVGKRKTYVMGLLGITCDEDGRYPDYNDLLLLRGNGIRTAFVTFLMIQQSLDWAYMMHAVEELEILMRLPPSIDSDAGIRRRKQMEECRSQIEEAMARLTVSEKSRTVLDSIEWFRAQRTLNIRPEERMYDLSAMTLPENATEGGRSKK